MADPPEPAPPLTKRLQEVVGSVSSVVAPITLISAILFYFGYVYTTTEYGYFGLDVDTIGLSTQEFIMRSPGPLLTPLLGAGLIAAVVAVGHAAVRRRIEAATASAPWRLSRFRRVARVCALLSGVALGAGGALVVGYGLASRLLPLYSLVTPAVLALGAAAGAYAVKLGRVLDGPPRRVATVGLYAVLTTSLLWATATLAEYAGLGAAVALGQQLTTARPSVVLDTKERLYLTTMTVEERALPAGGEDQAFRFRYRNLRLLIQGEDRLFLVPSPWDRGDPTLVVPMDGEVRVWFQTG
jgi:hypothetical protein